MRKIRKISTVAIVDSGIDATHPDLADHVVHNVNSARCARMRWTAMRYLSGGRETRNAR